MHYLVGVMQPSCNPRRRLRRVLEGGSGHAPLDEPAADGALRVIAVTRGEAGRDAHNPKVAGSNPAPATKKALVSHYGGPGLRRSQRRLLMVLLMLFAEYGSRTSTSRGVSDAAGPRLT